MDDIRYDRLMMVADHLKYGRLGHAKFDFAVMHENPNIIQRIQGHYGSNGCAIGEFPIIFPEHFSLRNANAGMGPQVYVNGVGFLTKRQMICDFFEINQQELDHFFYPRGQITQYLHPDRKEVKLDTYSTKEEVAQNIEWFVQNKGFRKPATHVNVGESTGEIGIVSQAQQILNEE